MAIDVKQEGNKVVITRKGLVVIGVQGVLNMPLDRVKQVYDKIASWETGVITGKPDAYDFLPMFNFEALMNLDVNRAGGAIDSFAVAEGIDKDKLDRAIDEFADNSGFIGSEPRENFASVLLSTFPTRAGIYGFAESMAERTGTFERAYGGANYFTFLCCNGWDIEEAKRLALEKIGLRL